MNRVLRRVLRLALAISAIGAVAAGIAYATVPDSGGVIHGCYGARDGSVRVIDADAGQACGARETPLAWSQQGPPGPAGPPGPSDAYATFGLVHLEAFGPRTTVANIEVPAGSYVVTASVNGYADAGIGTTAQCAAPGSGNVDLRLAPLPDVRNAPIVGWLTRSTPGEIAVQCRLFDGGGSAYVRANVVAIKVGTITTPYPYEQ